MRALDRLALYSTCTATAVIIASTALIFHQGSHAGASSTSLTSSSSQWSRRLICPVSPQKFDRLSRTPAWMACSMPAPSLRACMAR